MNQKFINTGIFRCPACGSKKLKFSYQEFHCGDCKKKYISEENKYYFADINPNSIHDTYDKIKTFFKKYPRLYQFLMNVLGPVYTKSHQKRFIKTYTGMRSAVDLHLGSGNIPIADWIINLDIYPYENVDITADIHSLPISDNSADTIICSAVLEHVKDPRIAVQEIWRVLKPGGLAFCYMPFMCGFHASPDDYSRLTLEGMKILFNEFNIIELGVGGGPTSGFLWLFQEWFAILFSFGSKTLHLILLILIMCLTFPLKYLDILLACHPAAKNIASGFYIIVRKK